MILAALALSACLLQELTIEELIQQLESDGVREREEALGASSMPEAATKPIERIRSRRRRGLHLGYT
jgi:hypothetical protein